MNGVELAWEFESPNYLNVHIPINIFIDNIRDFNLIKEYGSMKVSSEIQLFENKEFFTKVGGNSAVPMCSFALHKYGYQEIRIVLDPPIQIYG